MNELSFPLSRPPLRYHGSKWRIAPWLLSHFPPHGPFIDVFGGGGSVLLRKPLSKIEVYNDLDDQVVNFFTVLRHPSSAASLQRLLTFTPFSRSEFDLSYQTSLEPVEAARRFVFRLFAGHGTSSIDPRDSNGFRSCDIRSGKSYAREWRGVPGAIAITARRFQCVTIENLDFRRLIPKFSAPDSFFYCDPPYPLSLRNNGGKGYVHEMSIEDHRQLIWILKSSKVRAMISSYPNALYGELLSNWRRIEKKTTANGQRGAVPRTECIWLNYDETGSLL